MHHDRLNPHYIRGFVKECHDAGLNEEQTSGLLDEQLKYHLAETNEHYREGIKQAVLEKQAGGLKSLLGLGAMAGGGALLGGAALNAGPQGARNIANNGVDLSFGAGGNTTKTNISGNALGGVIGGGLGLASMLRRGRIGSLKNALPFSKRILTNAATGKVTKGFGMDLAKPFRNPKDALITAGFLGSGATAGALAPSVNKSIEGAIDGIKPNKIDGARAYLEQQGYSVGQNGGAEDPIQPWYAGQKANAGGDMSNQIPNLSLLPQEVRDAARNGGAAGGASALMGPNGDIASAGAQLQQLENQMAKLQTTANNPDVAPMEKFKALEGIQALTAKRDLTLKTMSEAQKTITNDQRGMAAKLTSEKQRTASHAKMLADQQALLAGGPQRDRYKPDSVFGYLNPLAWGMRGAMPTQEQHRMQQGKLQEQMLRNEQRQWDLENQDTPTLMSPESQQLLTTHGL